MSVAEPDPSPERSGGDQPVTAAVEGASEVVEEVAERVDEVVAGAPPEWSQRLTARLAGFDDAVDARFDALLRGRPPVDRLMYSVTELADFSLLWHLLAWTRGITSARDEADAVRLTAVLAAESTVVNAGLKSLFRRRRPVPEHERPHHLRIPLTSSFPSGHASAAFCAATLLADGRSRPRAAAWFALAGLVASSRVHVKIHHASDVLGGAVVGLTLGQVARRLWPQGRLPTRSSP